MPLEVQLLDGCSNGRRARIDSTRSLQTTIREGDAPEKGAANKYRFLSQLTSSDGVGGGTTSMDVDGSSTAQLFTVDAQEDFDIRIMKIMIFIEDTTVSHSTFGAIAALTNGVDISVIESGVETFLVQSATKFADLIEQTLAASPFGDDASAFELISVTGTADAQILPMDIGALVPGGLRIGRGTADRFQVEVNDDLTGLDLFTVRVLGYRHYPPFEADENR